MLYSNKRLKNTKLYKEHNKLQESLYKVSLQKEAAQQKYLKEHIIINSATNEAIDINYSFEKYYKKYTKSIEQKIYTIEAIAKEKDLEPVFMTLTLPSMYHPFQSIGYKGKRLYTALNSEFAFKNIEEAIKEGYEMLNHIYRTFYKRLKKEVKELMFIRVIEAHKTFVPHMHILFFLKSSKKKIFLKHHANIVNEFNLSQTDLELKEDNELQENETKNVVMGINRAAKYITKYITKTLNDGEDYFNARVLDGYKRLYKMRMITMSNLDLSLADFRTIYYNLDIDTKEKLLAKAKSKEQAIFHYIMQNIFRVKIINSNAKTSIKKFGNIDKSELILILQATQINNHKGGYGLYIHNLKLFVNHKLIYDKPNFQTIRRA